MWDNGAWHRRTSVLDQMRGPPSFGFIWRSRLYTTSAGVTRPAACGGYHCTRCGYGDGETLVRSPAHLSSVPLDIRRKE